MAIFIDIYDTIITFSVVLVVEPIVPTITTQLKSDGRTHAVVTVYPNADNLGCKK